MKSALTSIIVMMFLVFGLNTGIQAAEQQPIKIGAMFALSGPAAHIGTPTKLVAEMAVAEIKSDESQGR